MMRLLLLLGVAMIGIVTSLSGQMKSSVDRDTIRIGEQIKYSVYLPKNTDIARINNFPDTLGKFTVVANLPLDTTSDAIIQSALITAFDSGTWTIPEYQIDSLKAPPIQVYTNTVAVDTSKPFKPVYGIKEVEDQTLFSWWPWLLIIPLLGFLIWYFGFRPKKQKSTPVIDSRTPYEKAMAELNQLNQSKAWAEEETSKEYYADLTDIMRHYFQDQYGVQAMESNTSELLDRIRPFDNINNQRDSIAWVLHRADLAKFAKTRPTIEENREALSRVKSIISFTKPKVKKEED